VLARRQAARAGAHDRHPLRPVIHCSNDLEFCTLMSANVMIFGRTAGNTVCSGADHVQHFIIGNQLQVQCRSLAASW
jgi:hypothetical protein